MNLKRTAKELQSKANQLLSEAEKYQEAARMLEELEPSQEEEVEEVVVDVKKAEARVLSNLTKKKRRLSLAGLRNIRKAQRARRAREKRESGK